MNLNYSDSSITKDTKIVLITVPHGSCPINPQGHECDFSALYAAAFLNKIFMEKFTVNKKNLWPILLIPDVPRKECDLNRYNCRNKPYRSLIRKKIKELDTRVKFVLDVHSFPSNEKSFGDNIDVALLDNPSEKKQSFETYSKVIQKNLKNEKLNSVLLQGINNDIQYEMKTKFILPSILVEFNESNSTKTDSLICTLIVNTLNDLFGSK